jgi:Na+/H+ antiporter NhaC
VIEEAIAMRCWTILALLVAVCVVFLGAGHSEEIADDLREADLKDDYRNNENDEQL